MLKKEKKCASCEKRRIRYINAGGIPSLYRNRKKCKECGKEPAK